jgi:DNA-directed RNA polymerase alpha subunit
MDNKTIIEKVYKLQLAIRKKNAMIANALEKATIPLLEYKDPLESATKAELMKIKGVGQSSAEMIIKIINGDNIHNIVKETPEPKKGRLGEMKWKW